MCLSVCPPFLEDRKLNAIVLLLYHETNVFTAYCIVSSLGRRYRKLQGHCREPRPSAVMLCVCVLSLSHVLLFVTLWTVAHQAPLSIGFPRQEYWSG